jgi:dsDNA-binding SOS-regulon protein
MAEAMGRRESLATWASPIDPQLLAKVLADNMHLITNMGEYESISRPMAAKGSGLVKLAPLIESIVDMQPCAELPLAQLKNTLLQLVLERPSWNGTRYRNDHYAGMRTERVMTLLHHVRRVVREPRRRAQLNLKISGAEATLLDNIFAKVTLRQMKGAGDLEEAGMQDSPKDGDDPMEAAGAEDSPMDEDPETQKEKPETLATMGFESESAPEDEELSQFDKMLDTVSQVSAALNRSTSLSDTLQQLQNSDLNLKEKMDLLQKSLGKNTPKKAAALRKSTPKKQKDTPKKQKDTPKKQTPEKDTSLKFVVMYYKQNNSFGVRHSGGGKQVLSVCKKGLAKPVLEDLAHKAKRSLEMGDDPLETRCVVKLKLLELAKDLESGA